MEINIFDNVEFPVISAPMFLASGVDLVVACCANGIIGSFPALNQRTTEGFEEWLVQINSKLNQLNCRQRTFGVNLIVHKSNPRVDTDLAMCIKYEVPLLLTSLGAAKEVIDGVHSYGGKIFHDVINVRHAKKAMDAGVDGLVLVAAGAGGHGGLANPFALLSEVRSFFDGYIALAGSLTNGAHVASARAAGADFAYIGTRFIATDEAYADQSNKQMIVESTLQDIVYTNAFSGVYGNFLRQSILDAGLDPDNLPDKEINFGKDLNPDKHAWKNIWSAGHGVSDIDNILPTAELIAKMKAEYQAAVARVTA
ncbi:MAG: nitronate monooxygenase [Rhodospirillales bacterium]|nr:nitronate monooxygenase [Rhodospirillales bacterium]|tara:strand:+ start:1194 stop:2126 length:933 start_codon:yes stop_codon:yes gene_type:complete